MALTVDDVKKELPPQDYRTMTLGDDSVAERCLTRATLWVKGKVASTGTEFNEEDVIVMECILKRAVYELFSFVGQESRAKMKERDVEDLIESYFGDIKTKNDAATASGSGPAAGYISKPSVPRYGR